MTTTPLDAAKEAVRLRAAFEANWHPMGGHGDPVRGPGFDYKYHMQKHGDRIVDALIAAEKALREIRATKFDPDRPTDGHMHMRTIALNALEELGASGG